MPSRRKFFKHAASAAAGMLLAGPGVARSAAWSMQTGAPPRRREVRVGGRRIKTVDIHCHTVVPEAVALMGGTTRSDDPNINWTARLQAMDQQGIDVQALSINSSWYGYEPTLARRIIDVQNAGLAAVVAAHPDRFVALATVALQHPQMAAEHLEEAVKRYGMRGADILASVEDDELSAPKFDPFWAKAEELGALIFIHPRARAGAPGAARLQGNGVLTNVIGNPLETTIALSHLIFEGTLDRFPGLRICAAHGGGYLASYSARMDHGCSVFPEQCKEKFLKKQPSEYMKQIYVDSLVFTSEGLRHLVAESGAGQIMIGTDYPFTWNQSPVDHILGTPGLSDADRIAILGGTACKLLGIPLSFT